MTASGLSCKELVEIVTDYIEGRLPPDERVRFEDHLSICEGCANYLDQMRQTIRLLGTLPEERIGDDAKRDLMAAFRDWKR